MQYGVDRGPGWSRGWEEPCWVAAREAERHGCDVSHASRTARARCRSLSAPAAVPQEVPMSHMFRWQRPPPAIRLHHSRTALTSSGVRTLGFVEGVACGDSESMELTSSNTCTGKPKRPSLPLGGGVGGVGYVRTWVGLSGGGMLLTSRGGPWLSQGWSGCTLLECVGSNWNMAAQGEAGHG